MFGYLGNSPAYGLFEKQVLTPDGVADTFPLLFRVGNSTSILVVKDGEVLESGVGKDYVVAAGGTVISFTVAPLITDNIFLLYLGRELLVPRVDGIWDSGSWTPVITASGAMTITGLSINEAKFQDLGQVIHYKLDITLTPDGVLDDKIIFSLPVSQSTSENVVAPVKLKSATVIEHGHLERESTTEIAILREDEATFTNEEYRIQISGQFDKL